MKLTGMNQNFSTQQVSHNRQSRCHFLSSPIASSTLESYKNDKEIVDPKFFGVPSMLDFIRDMESCLELGIEFKGKARSQIKANILSKLTGESPESMHNFFVSKGPADNKNNQKQLEELGLIATKSRAINKAIIINALIEKQQLAAMGAQPKLNFIA